MSRYSNNEDGYSSDPGITHDVRELVVIECMYYCMRHVLCIHILLLSAHTYAHTHTHAHAHKPTHKQYVETQADYYIYDTCTNFEGYM